MKVFFTSENESVSTHSLDTLDSRKKKKKDIIQQRTDQDAIHYNKVF